MNYNYEPAAEQEPPKANGKRAPLTPAGGPPSIGDLRSLMYQLLGQQNSQQQQQHTNMQAVYSMLHKVQTQAESLERNLRTQQEQLRTIAGQLNQLNNAMMQVHRDQQPQHQPDAEPPQEEDRWMSAAYQRDCEDHDVRCEWAARGWQFR